MEETLYFAYGSNINLEQMEHRCPDALLVGPVTLQNYELQFRGSGFATVAPKKDCVVHGLYRHRFLDVVAGIAFIAIQSLLGCGGEFPHEAMNNAAFLGRDSGEAVAAELQFVVLQRHRPNELGVWTAMLHLF